MTSRELVFKYSFHKHLLSFPTISTKGIQIWDFLMLEMSDTGNHRKSYLIPSHVEGVSTLQLGVEQRPILVFAQSFGFGSVQPLIKI